MFDEHEVEANETDRLSDSSVHSRVAETPKHAGKRDEREKRESLDVRRTVFHGLLHGTKKGVVVSLIKSSAALIADLPTSLSRALRLPSRSCS
jgi:hypothetical protein